MTQFSLNLNKEAYFMISLFIISIISVTSCSEQVKTPEKIPYNNQMKEQFIDDITMAINTLDSARTNTGDLKKNFLKSRKYFKKTEPILASLDIENYGFLNQPNILKIEEEDYTDIKIKNPSGYQVLEEEIFTEQIDTIVINKHLDLVSNRLKLIKKNISFNHIKTYHFLWLLRKSIIQISLTGITGFDSPVLENSLEESKTVYQSLKTYLAIFEKEFKNKKLFDHWNTEIDASISDLKGDFNTFNRYDFIKNHTHKQLELWNKIVADWNVSFPFELAIKNDATSLFSANTYNNTYFADRNSGKTTPEKIALGKKLFYDTNLSSDKKISCATCHHLDKAFTDGLKIGAGVTRNTPTLLYSGLQQAFFYDKRAGSLEGQIIAVVENENEFHTDLETLGKVVAQDSSYPKEFNTVFKNQKVNNAQIRNAIASYIRSLAPFNSKFDQNINGIENTLTKSEINGFNLFNGKAKCATCHFAPIFNGTVPPNYRESEIELIGVPKENDTINATISEDLGRYDVYKTEQRKHFFKTSTVRNVSKTGPYMHNGVYQTLEEVLDFYNRGGGAGIGIDATYQTLPPDPLHLSKEEIKDIIAFMNSLEDQTKYEN
ncbi:cytochrome-c peroxidase [Aquimarina algiphila]|uniref:Methylamine utilization protein n=1 Tax=Aquimarina algiphila TaxID=2047982 RepID=A0A554VBY8_9FLAO|nr:cytochrome c peroxidase [Aquimarina algiphila]TSE04120.1 methylamine utilization protein [Aquimarina algiphila]